jgi:hypothetical protein
MSASLIVSPIWKLLLFRDIIVEQRRAGIFLLI